MSESRELLQHVLAAIAYRTQKALRGAPAGFADFRAGVNVRTPHELVWHMTGLIGYARTMFHGGNFAPPAVATLDDEVARFHATLAALRDDLANTALEARITDRQLLHGPLADAMTHVGQLAMLRRLAGDPVPSENFIGADITAANVSADQPAPRAPDGWWRPDQPPMPPGPLPGGGLPDDADALLRRLAASRAAFLAEVARVPAARQAERPAPDRWSVAEIVEHVARIERSIAKMLVKRADEPLSATAAELAAAQLTPATIAAIADRSRRIEAPEWVRPSGSVTPDEAVAQLAAAREALTTAYRAAAPALLDGAIHPHPLFGPITFRGWVEFAAYHESRHAAQIAEQASADGEP